MPPRLSLAPALAAALALAACRPQARPWDPPDGAASEAPWPTPTATPTTFLPAPDAAPSGDPSAPALPASPASTLDTPADPPTPPVRVGGPWVRCYGHFRPSGEPVKDVTRLSILCGPENGMRRLSKQPLEGDVAEGGPPVTETFQARRGECYRVFAVATPGVADLDVIVRSSRGSPVAADHGEDAWPIVQPDCPFCPLEDDRYSVEVTARRGRGRFASEVWVLRTPAPK